MFKDDPWIIEKSTAKAAEGGSAVLTIERYAQEETIDIVLKK